MSVTFYKYQGTGNDFIIIDNRDFAFNKANSNYIKQLCNRRFGIGADGLILLENHATVDFKMIYFNADGNQSTMCGNGGRCIVAFAKFLNLITSICIFEAIDGLHEAEIKEDGLVKLKMQDVSEIKKENTHVFLDTGSPHHVLFNNNLDSLNVNIEGAKIRYSSLYKTNGCNVNFVQKVTNANFKVRTYERGVESETLSCGTGVTAVAIAMHYIGETKKNSINLETQGGQLQVVFTKTEDVYEDVWLIGPTQLVYTGTI